MPDGQTKQTALSKILPRRALTSPRARAIINVMEINVNGTTLYYERTGSGRPLLLLHGNGETHEIFDEAARTLSASFTVYAIDTRGHGKSAPVAVYHYADMAEDVAAFVKALSLEGACVYGFSDGGITALMAQIAHPHLFSRIAVSGANLVPEGLSASFLAAMRQSYKKKKDPLTAVILQEPAISLCALERITEPVFVLAGEHDIVREKHTRAIAKHIPASVLYLLKGETHDSYVVHAPALAALLAPFFR